MPVSPDLAWQLADDIGLVYALSLSVSEAELEGEGVRSSEFIAMVILTSFPDGLSQTAWGRYQGVSRQRAHAISKTLVSGDLITVEKRGRESVIRLTELGEEVVERLRPAISLRLSAMMDALSALEAQTLSRLLKKVVGHAAHMEAAADKRAV